MNTVSESGTAAGPVGGKWSGAAACAAIGTMLLISSFLFAWWGSSLYDESGDDPVVVGLDQRSIGNTGLYNMDIAGSKNGTDLYGDEESSNYQENVFLLYFIVTLMVIVALALGAAVIPKAITFGIGKSGKGGAIGLAAMAMVFALVAPLLLFFMQPIMMEKDQEELDDGWETPDGDSYYTNFMGKSEIGESSDVYVKWGPDMGWFLSLGAGVMFLISVILLAKSGGAPAEKKKKGKGDEEETPGPGEPSSLINTPSSIGGSPATPAPMSLMTPPGASPSLAGGASKDSGDFVGCPQCNTQIKTPPTRPAQIQCPNCGLKGTIN